MTNSLSQLVADRYGSKKGLLRTHWYRLLYYLGFYSKYRVVDWREVQRLVFVCKGNICRSAYAEAVASELGISVTSFGLDTVDGAPANEIAMRVAALKGVDLSGHRTRQMTSYAYQSGDLLLAMEPWQIGRLESLFGDQLPVSLLGLWGGLAYPHIEDPYNSPAEYFHYCFDLISTSIVGLQKHMEDGKK